MAKSFDKLVRKTGNKKTRQIASKRTKELIAEYDQAVNGFDSAENSEIISKIRRIFLGKCPTKDGSVKHWGTDQLDEEVADLVKK